jgi:hypothetical protein
MAPPSTKSRTRTIEDHRASSFAFASRYVASSALSCPAASSRRSASQTRPGGGPSSRSQIRVAGYSNCECRPPPFEFGD